MIVKHNEGRWTKLISDWNPAISTKQKEYRKRGTEERTTSTHYLQPIRIDRDSNDLTSDMTWLTTAHGGSKWDSIMESDTCNDHHHQTPRTNHAHDSKAHDQDEGGATNKTTTTHCSSPPKGSVEDLPKQHSHHSKQTSKNGNQSHSDSFIPSETQFPFEHRCRPTSCQVARGSRRSTWENYCCTEQFFFAKKGRGQGPRTLAVWPSGKLRTGDWTSDHRHCCWCRRHGMPRVLPSLMVRVPVSLAMLGLEQTQSQTHTQLQKLSPATFHRRQEMVVNI